MRIVPDKSWIVIPRMERSKDNRYANGLNAFIQYAEANPRRLESERLYCPCCRCRNTGMVESIDIVQSHYDNQDLTRHTNTGNFTEKVVFKRLKDPRTEKE